MLKNNLNCLLLLKKSFYFHHELYIKVNNCLFMINSLSHQNIIDIVDSLNYFYIKFCLVNMYHLINKSYSYIQNIIQNNIFHSFMDIFMYNPFLYIHLHSSYMSLIHHILHNCLLDMIGKFQL